MNSLSKRTFKITLWLITATVLLSFNPSKKNKVLIIGIDGTRPDAILATKTPNIDSLWQNGAYSFNAQTDEISSSGICWTGMLTGVWHDKHNVLTNNYENPNVSEYPHFFRRVKEYDQELKTYSVIQWTPLHKILQDGDADLALDFKTDEEVTLEASTILENEDVDVLFVHLDDVDHAGHDFGFHPDTIQYATAIEKADGQVGQIIRSLRNRSTYKNENWLILMSTDHGGSGTGHGQDIPEHTTIYFIASGEDVVAGEINESVNVIDVAVTALAHLGVPIKAD